MSDADPDDIDRASPVAGGGEHRDRRPLPLGSSYVGGLANWIDHLVLAAPSLDAGDRLVSETIGVSPVFGGRHEGRGTHNSLLSLGAPTYLEVLAPDPDQPGTSSALLGPDELTHPRLLGFAVGCSDLDGAVDSLRSAGVADVGDPFPMSRRRPDGGLLAWRLAMIAGSMGGARPFLISWDDGGSPAHTAPVGGRLVALAAGDPDPGVHATTLDTLGVDVELVASADVWLAAEIQTEGGAVVVLR
jgi:hypothetical protein